MSVITSLGYFLPDKIVSNSYLADKIGKTEQWIEEKTGILERRALDEGATSDMLIKAIEKCLALKKIKPIDIDCIIVATITADYLCPSTASIVQNKIGAVNAWGFDISSACSGFIYGIQIANSLLNSKTCRNVIVCSGDKMRGVIDEKDRKTTVLFGDGAGAALLEDNESYQFSVLDTICGIDSRALLDVHIPGGGSRSMLTPISIENGEQYLRITGHVFQNGVLLFIRAIQEILDKNHLKPDDIDLIIPHQANKRMIEALADQMQLSINKFYINIEYIGNTGGGSVPIALSQAIEQGRNKNGGKILLVSIGAGFTYAACILN